MESIDCKDVIAIINVLLAQKFSYRRFPLKY